VLGHRAVNRTLFGFCPKCVAEDLEAFPGPAHARAWLRLEWMIGHFRVCNQHGIHLAHASPIRRRFEPFDFAETVLLQLTRLQDLIVQATAADHSDFQDWMQRRLDGHRDTDMWLDQFPLHVAVEWCEALGVSALHDPKVQASTLTQADWARAADQGFRLCAEGENGVLALLERLNEAQRGTRGFWGLRDTYGYAYGFLQRTVADTEFQPIRDLVRDFANRTVPIEPGTDVLGVVVDKPGVLTVRSAARASGVHDRLIRRIVEREGMAPDAIADGRRNHRVTVDASRIDGIVARLKDALTAPEVMELLGGIYRPHLNALIAIGALPTIGGSEKQAYAKHRFARDDIDAMVSRFLNGAVEVATPGPRQMSLAQARQTAVAEFETLLSLAFDGKLQWKGRLVGRHDYGALLVDVDEVIALVRAEPPMVHYTIGALRKLLGFSSETVEAFVTEELLADDVEFSPDARRDVRVITLESVELFRKNFVSLGELRDAAGLHVKQVKLLLKGAGIEPEYDPADFGVYVYDRKAVDKAVVERPDFWAYQKSRAQAAAR
jgi:predicted HTH domain antitoxin